MKYFDTNKISSLKDLNSFRKKLSKKYHPDIEGGSNEIMKKINEEYEKLKDFIQNKPKNKKTTYREYKHDESEKRTYFNTSWYTDGKMYCWFWQNPSKKIKKLSVLSKVSVKWKKKIINPFLMKIEIRIATNPRKYKYKDYYRHWKIVKKYPDYYIDQGYEYGGHHLDKMVKLAKKMGFKKI